MRPKRREHVNASPANASVGPLPERHGIRGYQRIDEDNRLTTLVQHAANELVPIVWTFGFGFGNPGWMWTDPPPQPRHDLLHAPTVSMNRWPQADPAAAIERSGSSRDRAVPRVI